MLLALHVLTTCLGGGYLWIFFVNDGVRAASMIDGVDSFSSGAVTLPEVVASKSISLTS